MKRLWLWLALGMIACAGPKATVATPTGEGGSGSVSTGTPAAEEKAGLSFSLRETQSRPEQAPRERNVQGKTLSERDAAFLWKGISPPKAEPEDVKTFAKREGSPPVPTNVEHVKEPFPPPVSDQQEASKAKPGPLEVLRVSPEGDVGLVRELSVTFNQPMVALTSHDESVAKELPVKLAPEPRGHFRWVGTRTLLFTADPRFPLATEYTVTVPKGTRALAGTALGREHVTHFRTPELAIVDAFPGGGEQKSGLLPIIVLAFNQHVRADAVLAALELKADGQSYPLRFAEDKEIAADAEAKAKLDQLSGEGMREYALVLRPEQPLPADSKVELTLAQGCAAGEGPRGTAKSITRTWHTHGALALQKVACGDGASCRPGESVLAQFTNTLDWEHFDPGWVRIEPSVEHDVGPSGPGIYLSANTLPRTKYTLYFSPDLRDVFGETLGKEASASFEVGDALPELSSAQPIVLLDPREKTRAFHVQSMNLDELVVTVRRVEPPDYPAYATARAKRQSGSQSFPLPGKVVWEKTLSLRERKNERVDTAIELAPALSNGLGHAIVSVEPRPQKGKNFAIEPLLVWVQASELALDAYWDDRELVSFSSSLADGSAQEGVSVELTPDGVKAVSDKDGLARMPLPQKAADRVRVLVAHKGHDSLLFPEQPWGAEASGVWTKPTPQNALRFHVFDDRGIYKPGETVHVKGWLRVAKPEHQRLPELPKGAVDSVSYELTDSRGAPIGKGRAKLNDEGGFDFAVSLPKTANLGGASLQVSAQLSGSQPEVHWHGFQIEEYRRPEYEVKVSPKEETHFVGQPIGLEAKASYHAGGPLAEAKVTWTVDEAQAHFAPPGHDSFTFGEQPLWWAMPTMMRGALRFPEQHTEPVTLVGRTDSQGLHSMEIVPERAQPAFAHELHVSAAVSDVNRQNFADHLTLLVHPAEVYVGVRTKAAFTAAGEHIEVEAIVTDLDGKAVKGRPVTVALVELSGKLERGELKSTEREVQRCSMESADDVVRCTLKAPRAGAYRIAARVLDANGKASDTHLRHWVAGEAPALYQTGQAAQLELVTDKRSYAPGETAKVLVRAPFAPADALLRVEHEGLVELQHVHMDEPSHTFEIKVSPEHVPSLHVYADLVGKAESAEGSEPGPAYASGETTLAVTLEHLRLKVEARPEQSALEPGAQTKLELSVHDAKGQAMEHADVAVVVVDEAVLSLVERNAQDALESMYPDVGSYNGALRARDFVRERSEANAQMKHGRRAGGPVPAPMLEAASTRMAMALQRGGAGAEVTPVMLRTMFDPLALFAGSVRTDAKGKASVTVKMPDTLTRYRVLSVAAHGAQKFGSGEAVITVRKALMLRPSLPRFVNMGDRLMLPVVVQNSSDGPMEVSVAVRSTNLTLGDVRAQRVSVPANDRVEVRFPAVTSKPGTVRLQFAAAADKARDATELTLPAWTPTTDEAFATYGELARDGASAYTLAVPKNVAREFGGLDVSLSSTQLSALTDALIATLSSSYDMPEQRASRILGALAIRDVLAAFAVSNVPDPAALNALVSHEIEELARAQHSEGGFGYYGSAGETQSYVSVHVSHALARAAQAKLAVPEGLGSRLRNYVRSLGEQPQKELDQATRATVLAYGAYSELTWGSSDTKLAELARTLGGAQLTSEAAGWLLTVFHTRGEKAKSEALTRLLLNRVSETAGAAEITSDAQDGLHLLLASKKRANAVVLEGLVRSGLHPELATKLARGLLAGRTRGQWEGTQENVFALLALRAYFDAFEKDVPHFEAKAFVGKTLAAHARFEGRSTKQEDTQVPMAFLESEHPDSLTLDKRGTGRLYYRLALAYAPKDFVLAPRDHGFVVERSYEAVDEPSEVRRDADGVWHVKAGARVRVELTMVASARRHHVALIDPLPAGFEAINPALAVSEPLPDQRRAGGPIPLARLIWPSTWFGQQSLRDERVEAHASELEAGVYTYTYYARATTPGSFIAPPAKAEEIYAPETFGRGATFRVVVE
jgi:uncharacterized protein YfaS (alpha-2-macroglobulin family)